MREQVPERTAGNPNQDEAQQKDQSVLAPSSRLVEGSRVRKHPIDPDRIGDVLDLAVSERFIAANQLVLDLLIDAARDEDLPRRGNALETRGNVDALTIDIILFDDDVAQIDPDPVIDAMIERQRCVASQHVLLNHDAATHCLDGTVKNCKEAVAGGFDEPPV